MKRISDAIARDWKHLLLLTLFVLIFFLPVFTEGRVTIPDLLNYYEPWSQYIPDLSVRFSHLKSDLLDASLPMFHHIKSSISRGELPLWNDIADLGKPLINQVPQFIISPVFIFMWFLPEEIGFTIGSILKALLSAYGMYYWLRQIKINKTLAVGGAVAFVFSGFNLSWFLVPQGTQNLLIPWVFLVTEKIFEEEKPLKNINNILVLTFFLSLILFSGFFATAGHLYYLLGFYVILKIFIGSRQSRSATRKNWINSISPGLIVLIAMLLSIGLGAITLLPSVDWVNTIDVTYRKVNNSGFYLPLKTLIQLGLPNYFGNPVFNNWQGVYNWNETSSFVTLICLVSVPLGIITAIKKRHKNILYLGGLAIFCILIIWRITPLLELIRALPIFDSSSNIRLIGPLTFLLISIGIYGLNAILDSLPTKKILIYYGFSALPLLLLIIRKVQFVLSKDALNLKLFDTQVFSIIMMIFALSIVITFLLIVWLRFNKLLSLSFSSLLITLLLIIEVLVFSYGHIPFVPRSYYFPKTKLTDYLTENIGRGRILVFDNLFMISGTQIYYGLDTALTHNLHTVREKELVTLFTENAWGSDTAPILKSEFTNFDSPMFEFYGVKYAVVSANFWIEDPTWELVGVNIDGANLYENLEWKNEHYNFSSNIISISTINEFSQNLKEVSSGEVVLYESDAKLPSEVTPTGKTNTTIDVIEDSPDSNKIRVCTENSGILNVRDTYWPGWSVKVNGQPVQLIRTNYIYRGVFLEKGCSVVTEEFISSSFQVGSLISLVSLIVFLVLWLFSIFYRNKYKIIDL